jgi:hypothetical protein
MVGRNKCCSLRSWVKALEWNGMEVRHLALHMVGDIHRRGGGVWCKSTDIAINVIQNSLLLTIYFRVSVIFCIFHCVAFLTYDFFRIIMACNLTNEQRKWVGDGTVRKICWFDEANFTFSGAHIRHNCVYYSTENLHVTAESTWD